MTTKPAEWALKKARKFEDSHWWLLERKELVRELASAFEATRNDALEEAASRCAQRAKEPSGQASLYCKLCAQDIRALKGVRK
jgi:hypothetical protein